MEKKGKERETRAPNIVMTDKISKKRAFTLIELLVVVAVLALLASIVTSNLGGAREGARISNALSFQSQTHSLLGSDLVGWWNFNEESGSVARDLSGYGNNGNITGATRVSGVPGTGGQALSFTGSHYVRMNPSNTILDNTGWTLSGWFNASQIDSGSIAHRVVTFHRLNSSPSWGTGGSLLLGNNSEARLMYTNAGGSQRYLIHSGIETERWYYFVGTYDGSTYRSYINGEDMQSRNDTFEGFGAADAMIGTYSTSNYFFRGSIDDVRIYSRALSASEIQTLYAQTKDNYLANE